MARSFGSLSLSLRVILRVQLASYTFLLSSYRVSTCTHVCAIARILKTLIPCAVSEFFANIQRILRHHPIDCHIKNLLKQKNLIITLISCVHSLRTKLNGLWVSHKAQRTRKKWKKKLIASKGSALDSFRHTSEHKKDKHNCTRQTR